MMLIIGIFIIFNPRQIQAIAREFLNSDALIFLSGVLTLPVGIAIAVSHNIWAADWRVIITLFGWIAIIAGIARIILPGPIKAIGVTMMEKKPLLTLPGATMILLGAYLSYHGYLT